VNEATGNLKRMLAPRDSRPSPEVFAPGPEGERARREFGERYTQMMKREWFAPGIHLGYVYEGSPVVVPDGTPPPPDDVMVYTQTARPGSRAPHVWLGEHRSTLDLFGRGFVLLQFDNVFGGTLERAAAKRAVPISAVKIENQEARTLYERRLVLVRPDGHVAWRADEEPPEAEALRIMDIVRGAAPVRTGLFEHAA
jgi:hypothetical protein